MYITITDILITRPLEWAISQDRKLTFSSSRNLYSLCTILGDLISQNCAGRVEVWRSFGQLSNFWQILGRREGLNLDPLYFLSLWLLFSLHVTTLKKMVNWLFQFNTLNESWTELPTKLPGTNQDFVATVVDTNIFPACGNNSRLLLCS